MTTIAIVLFTRTVKFVNARNIPVDSTVTSSVWLSGGPVGSTVVTMDLNHSQASAVDWIAIAIQSLVDSLTTDARILAVTATSEAPIAVPAGIAVR